MALSSIRVSLESSQGDSTIGIWRHRTILYLVTSSSKTGEVLLPLISTVTYRITRRQLSATVQCARRRRASGFQSASLAHELSANMDFLFLMLLSILILLGVGNSAPVFTPTTGTPSTASMTRDAAPATCPPNTSVFDSLNLTDPATWVELGIIWIGFFIGFLQACFIYYLLTGASSRRCGQKVSPDACDNATSQDPQRRSKRGPRRLCLFEWAMTRQDYEAYFWDPEDYGRRRYQEQEKQNLHSIIFRCFGRWLRLKSHKKKEEQSPPGAAGTVATFRNRRHHHPCELQTENSPDVLVQPNTDPAAFAAGALQEPYEPALSLYGTTRRRNVTRDRAQAWNDYSEASCQEVATTAREWSPNTAAYYDALDDSEKARLSARYSAHEFHRTVFRRACTVPIPAMRHETANATRATSEGSYPTKDYCAETSDLATGSYLANEYDARDYEAGASIDLGISSCGSSNGTVIWPTIRANPTRVMSNALPEQSEAASEASRISQVPQLNPSAGYVLPKLRYSATKPSIACTEPKEASDESL